ncbi:MAG: PA14 domain-containing protein [Methanothrix sp.]|nr:PA14 domain-containing protein [Methanothrix sp.]
MKLGFVLILIALNVLCISAMGQGSENPFGSATSDSVSLKGDIYYLPEGASSLPDFSSLTPVGSIYTTVLDIPTRSFTSGFPDVTNRFEWFAIRYTGEFNVDMDGDYAFRLVSDDGSRLFIDGKKIIDNDGTHPTQSVSGNAYLTRGQHSIEVDYFQGPREEIALQLFWTPPGGSEGIANPQYTPSTTQSSPISNLKFAGNPVLIQSRFGSKGNFELIVPLATGGLAHFWRDNDASDMPWKGPTIFGGTDKYDAVTMIQSNYGSPGDLEVVARVGDRLVFFWRDSGPSLAWNGPYPM